MSSAPLKTPMPESAYDRLLQASLHACEVAHNSAETLARGIGRGEGLAQIRQYEEELDALDREINEGVTAAIAGVPEKQARELLSFLKFIIELERIGDLLLNVANRAVTVASRLEPQDARDLEFMAATVSRMVGEVYQAYSARDLKRALAVLQMDTELDRVRNLMFVRHIDNPEKQPYRESFHIVFMCQTLERAGDHAKNLAEEICHLVSGRSVRHLLREYDKPAEQVFIERMRRQTNNRP
jgi:phosphate transport system protein